MSFFKVEYLTFFLNNCLNKKINEKKIEARQALRQKKTDDMKHFKMC